MAKTGAERSRENRERQKKDNAAWKGAKQKDRERKKLGRDAKRQTMSPEEITEHRGKEKARIKAIRNRKAACETESHIPNLTQEVPEEEVSDAAFKTPQSMGKALKRVNEHLPDSPRKRKAVAFTIAKQAGLKISMSFMKKGKPGPPGIDEETTKKVYDFYLKDEVSWQAPGKKDRVIVRQRNEQGQKQKIIYQARYMLMSLSEAYTMFRKDNEDYSCALSKFCELRPKYVLLFDKIPHNVCVCAQHENVRLLLLGLKSHTSPDIPQSTTAFIEGIVCDPNSKECMSGKCRDCAKNIMVYKPQVSDMGTSFITYSQWQQAEKVEIVATVEDALSELQRQVPIFLIHVYVKRKQASYFEKVKESVNGVHIALQVDFSENASLVHQNEVQSAHWAHAQATLFTAHTWIDQGITESIVIVSDELQHTKLSVYAFMTKIFGYLKEKYPEVAEVDIFSDGASSQFKQRFLFSNLSKWEEAFGLKLRWNFFATSHGKGVVDGLGGTVKRAVWRYVRCGTRSVVTPLDFYEIACSRNPRISAWYVTSDHINEPKESLEQYWSTTIPVPNTHKIHSVQSQGTSFLLVGDTSDSASKIRVKILLLDDDNSEEEEFEGQGSTRETPGSNEAAKESNQENLNLEIGDWVVVVYDDKRYPGQITSFATEEPRVKVRLMYKSGPFWKWPEGKPDEVYYFQNHIMKKIGLPIPAGTGHRGTFSFEQNILNEP